MNPRLWNLILNRFIIPRRAPASSAKYASIWTEEGPPLDVCMRSLAKKLRAALPQDKAAFVDYAMSYSAPLIEDAFAECKALGCDEVVVLPLYPQSAFSTTGVVKDKATEAMQKLEWSPSVRFVDSYCDEESYINAIADSISSTGFDPVAGDRLLFAFHSIPMADIRSGDTYEAQARRTAIRVAEKMILDDSSWRIGYQCRFDKSRAWLGPSTTEVLGELTGAKRLFVVAPNFSVDCLETHYDIDIVLRREYEAYRDREGKRELRYIPCLNDSENQIGLLRELIAKKNKTE